MTTNWRRIRTGTGLAYSEYDPNALVKPRILKEYDCFHSSPGNSLNVSVPRIGGLSMRLKHSDFEFRIGVAQKLFHASTRRSLSDRLINPQIRHQSPYQRHSSAHITATSPTDFHPCTKCNPQIQPPAIFLTFNTLSRSRLKDLPRARRLTPHRLPLFPLSKPTPCHQKRWAVRCRMVHVRGPLFAGGDEHAPQSLRRD